MATALRDPAAEDFQRWLDSQNPYKNQQTGNFDSYQDVLNGVRWRNAQAGKRNSLIPGAAPAVGGGTTTGSSGGQYSVLRLTKNPALANLFNNNLGSVSGNSGANYADLGRFIGALGQNNAANANDLNQEGGFIDSAYNGTLDTKLGASRTGYETTQRNSIASAGTALADARNRFGAQAGSDINQLQSDLATQRLGYEGRANADIGREVAARAADLTNYGRAAQAATQLGVNQGNRTIKAISQGAGGGGSSYTGRLGVGTAVAANTELAQRLAELKANNTEKELGRRANLTDTVSGLQRGEISGAGAARLGLTTQLAGQERGDLGYTLGRDATLNDTLYNAERGDIQYVRDQAGRLIGVRRSQRNATAQDALLPIQARSAIQSGDLEAAARLGALDQSNNFYGIDDGTGDALQLPRIPRLGRSGGYVDIGGGNAAADYFNPQQPLTRDAAPHQRSAAEQAYFNLAGEYPDGPNFEPNLWKYVLQSLQVRQPQVAPAGRPVAPERGRAYVPGDVIPAQGTEVMPSDEELNRYFNAA